jgi:hypothetical protein
LPADVASSLSPKEAEVEISTRRRDAALTFMREHPAEELR